MNEHIEPTEDGKRRYPQTGGYNMDFEPGIPCTCTIVCYPRCAGECGCEACKMVFAEYAHMSGWFSTEPQAGPTDEQLDEFRRALGPQKRA